MNDLIQNNSGEPQDSSTSTPELPNATSATSKSHTSILRCVHCNSEMLIREIQPEQKIRCSMCSLVQHSMVAPKSRGYRGISLLTKGEHRLAWWSLVLGLSSIILLFLTGIPSIYFGIRSFLKMKYVKPTKAERYAAVTGTLAGTFFGIFIGGIAILAAILAMAIYMSSNLALGEASSQVLLDSQFKIDIPDEIRPYKGRSILRINANVNLSDDPDQNQENRNVFMRLDNIGGSMKVNRNQITDDISERKLREEWKTKLIGKPETLTWQIYGEPRKVVFKRSKILADENETQLENQEIHRYELVFFEPNRSFALLLIFRNPTYSYTQDEVRAMFESLEFVQ